MAIDFNVTDVTHKIAVKFVHASLPDVKKHYTLRAVHQPEIDIHGIASKADVYNVVTSPKVIEEGLNAGLELIYHLVADGYKIKTPLFNMKIRVGGEYNGSETRLPDGVFPEVRLRPNAAFRKFLKERVKVEFVGVEKSGGFIAEAHDESTGLINYTATIGGILTIQGYGLKIEADERYRSDVGLFFIPKTGAPIKAQIVALNQPRTLKVIAPPSMTPGEQYHLRVVTQCSARNAKTMLKSLRDTTSAFALTALN